MTIFSYLRSIFVDDGAAYRTTAKITAADRDAALRFAGDEHWLVERYAGMLAEYREEQEARLKKPTLFWIDEDPETGYCDPWEAVETCLYHREDEGIAAIREGMELGVRYYARLRPHGDDDDDWTGEFDNPAEAEAGVAAERARRAALNGETA